MRFHEKFLLVWVVGYPSIRSIDDELGRSEPVKKYFSVDARTLLTLGRESIKDHTTAVLELVKNSYDAGAKVVDIEINAASARPTSWLLRIADNGRGMTADEVVENWLRIGFSSKRRNKVVGKRRQTGEKGIGRLSADRLGSKLDMRTRATDAPPARLKVAWDKFDSPGKNLTQIAVDLMDGPPPRLPANDKDVPAATGTELLITGLRQRWTTEDITNLYNELAILTPPTGAAPDFSLRLTSDVAGAPTGEVHAALTEIAEIDLTVSVTARGSVQYDIQGRDKQGARTPLDVGEMTWGQFLQKTTPKGEKARQKPRFGSATVRLMFFPKNPALLRGSEFRMSQVTDFLEVNAGVRIYRDGIRVQPYGNRDVAEGDWLGLSDRKIRDPAGRGRKTFKVAANQVVGSVFIGRDRNRRLVDSSSREGLVHNDAYRDLRDVVIGVVRLLETQYHQTSGSPDTLSDRPPVSTSIAQLGDNLAEVEKTLRDVVRSANPERASRVVQKSLQQLTEAVQQAKVVQSSVDELESQTRTYRGLATVGIAAAVFGHETQSAIALFTGATRTAIKLLTRTPDKIEIALEELGKSLASADRVGAWGHFALSRVRRDKRRRRKTDLTRLATDLVAELKPVFASSSIDLQADIDEVSGVTFAMDIEAVLINLLTNAYAACQQSNRQRVARVEVKAKRNQDVDGIVIRVADSGPGVAAKFREQIWEPLFTTKAAEGGVGGTGLGLSMVHSVVEEPHGPRSVSKDDNLKGAAFEVWLPLA